METGHFGDHLRQQRLQQGYTIADIESAIKIRGIYIRAIEDEDFSLLPARVYTVGFVRRYATFLKAEPLEEIVQYYKTAHTEDQTGNVPEMQGIETSGRNSRLKEKKGEKIRYDRILLTILLVMGAAWAGIFAFSFISEKWENYQQSRPQQEEAALPEQNLPEEQPSAPVEEEPMVWDHLQVKLTMKEGQQCWLSVTADGESIYNGIKNSGETLEFTAQAMFDLQLGNAGAVQLQVNETDMTDPAWQPGQVTRFTYTMEQWTATSSETPPAPAEVAEPVPVQP